MHQRIIDVEPTLYTPDLLGCLLPEARSAAAYAAAHSEDLMLRKAIANCRWAI